jgi:hypothetical protein
LPGERIRGSSSTVCITPALQKGHWKRSNPVRRATKIIYQGESCIKVDFPSNQEITALIKYIEDAYWSKTFAAWYITYTNTVFNQLKSLFPEIRLIGYLKL